VAAGPQSPRTVLVFLLVGSASHLAALALVRKGLGARTAALYLGGVLDSSLLLGLGLDAGLAAPGWHVRLPERVGSSPLATPAARIAWTSLALLVLAAVRPAQVPVDRVLTPFQVLSSLSRGNGRPMV
jgi:hypothetical protein